MHHEYEFLKLVEKAKQQIVEISPTELKEKMKKPESYILLDVRENDEWTSGFISGALHMPRGILERDVEKVIADKSTEIIVYCGGGYRSALACQSLKQMGYKNAKSLATGIKGWRHANGPLENE